MKRTTGLLVFNRSSRAESELKSLVTRRGQPSRKNMREIFSLPRKFAASLLQLQGRIALNLNGWTLEMAALPWNGVSNSHSAEKSHGRWSLFNEYHSLEICLDSGHSMPWWLMWKETLSDFLRMMLRSQWWYSRFWVESMCHHMSNWAWLWSTLPLHWAPLLPLYLSNVSFSPLWFASHPEGFLALLNKWLTHLSYLILPLFILQDRDISGSLFVWLSLSKYRTPIWANKSSCVGDLKTQCGFPQGWRSKGSVSMRAKLWNFQIAWIG